MRYKTLAERLADVDVNVSRNIEFVPVAADEETAVGDPSSAEEPHFLEVLRRWHQQNRTQDFADCYDELRPMVQSLPMLVFNLKAIVDILLRSVAKPKSMASEPVLMLLGALGRDVRAHATLRSYICRACRGA